MWKKDHYILSDQGVVSFSVRSLLGNLSPTINGNDCFQLFSKNVNLVVVGSCKGLVCYRQYVKQQYCFYFWNPATKLTSKKLACLHVGDSDCHYCNRYRFAFGYDKLSDTYKLLAFLFDCKAKESQKNPVKICSFGDNRWRNIDNFPVIPFDSHHLPGLNDGIYLNGTLNWLALCNNNYIWDDTSTIAQMVIVSLDLGMETYTQLLLPCLNEALLVPPLVPPIIGVLKDCLCFSHDWKKTHLVVWQMKDFGIEKSWTKLMKVSYQNLQIIGVDHYPLLPFCKSENGDVLIMGTLADSQAILYHWKDNRVERTNFDDIIYWNDTKDYVESLVSPCCN